MLLDFSQVGSLSSEMVGQLFMLANRCKSKEISLKACNLSAGIREILETVRLSDFLEIHDDEASARQAFVGDEDVDSQAFDIHPDLLKKEAAEGDTDAELELAICYEQGRGVAQDVSESLAWLRRAAEHRHPDAQYKLAMAYAYGIHLEPDYSQAIYWYERAAEQDQAEAQYALGMTYRYGITVPEDPRAATAWYERAAAQGHERAAQELQQLQAAR
jgi:TPR repeat protein